MKNCIRRKWVKAFCLVSLVIIPIQVLALPAWLARENWHPVITLGVGNSISSDVGESQNFPVQNPVTDQFYNYSANHSNQASGLFYGFLGAEWNLQPRWLLQAGVSFNQASPFSAKGTLTQGADIPSSDTYTYQYSVRLRQLLLEGKLLYTLQERYHPYVLAGLGPAFNNAYNYYTSVPPFLTFTRLYSDNTSTSFSYAAGIGIDVDITCYLRAGLGYRFADLGEVSLGNATIDGVGVSGTLSQSHLYTNELLAQLTWIFN